MTTKMKEIDKHFRETPPDVGDVEIDITLEHALDNLEKGLTEEQIKALKL